MRKLRAIIIFALIPFTAGYLIASHQEHKLVNNALNFNNQAVLPTDKITLVEKGTISSVSQNSVITIVTNHPQLIEAIPYGDSYISVDKQTNYSSLLEFSSMGVLKQTLFKGNTDNIDTMDWYTDPVVNVNQKKLAFVSDKDKDKTNILDNALFVENLTSGSIEKIADPDPHSGGIAHPVWGSSNPNLITYDYYQYDTNYNPYSVIEEYNLQTQTTNPLTTQKQNAYQESFSPNGKQILFLERGNDITTGMYLANVNDNVLVNIHTIATGDFAYPTFSNTPNHIYFLQAHGNTGYNLFTATLSNDKLTNISAISTGEQLQANSGFTLSSK